MRHLTSLWFFVAVFLLGTTVAARAQDDEARTNRLSEIVRLLPDKKNDGVTLLTEAVRLCGFSIWTEDRAKLHEPLTMPGLGLAITDKEIEGYVDLFRRGDRVAVADLANALDPIYRSVGGKVGLNAHLKRLLQTNLFNNRAPVRSLSFFLQELGKTHEDMADAPMTLDSRLDSIQSLLVLRVISEEMGGPLRKSIAKNPEIFASMEFEFAQDDAPGWAEDAFAGGITGLWEEVVSGIGEAGGKVTNAVGKANALAAISKFILTYKFLKGEVTLEGKGQPLVRTKDYDAGDERTTVARFFIDGTGVTDWLKDNRKWFHTLGLDLDTPKSGPLKNVETFWELDQSRKYATKQLVQAVRGTTDLSRLKTDENGEAKVTWEGKPQPKKIDPTKAMPVMKSVWMHIAPQVKNVEMQQDIVDAVTGAIGLKEGPSGALSPIMEILYRMKWHAPAHFELQVKDWVEGETIGQLTVEAKGSGHSFGRETSIQMSIDHSLTITDMQMSVVGGEAYPTLDPKVIAKLPPDVQKQMEAGMKEMAEAAKKRHFGGIGPGIANIQINDSSFIQHVGVECGTPYTNRIEETWKGSKTEQIQQYITNQFGFTVDANLEKKIATVKFEGWVEGVHTLATGKENQRNNRRFNMYTNIELEPGTLDSKGQLELPLKETPLQNQSGFNYNGTKSIKFKFGPKNQFTGTMIVSYSVTRKMPPKAPAKK